MNINLDIRLTHKYCLIFTQNKADIRLTYNKLKTQLPT